MNPFIRPWRQVFDFRGRATRTEYALFHVTMIFLYFALVGLNYGFMSLSGPGPIKAQPGLMVLILAGILAIFQILMMLAFLIGHISIAIRRLHDHGEPWTKYLLTFIPLIGIVFWAMLVFTKGDDFENDYGFDPRHPEQPGVDELSSVFS